MSPFFQVDIDYRSNTDFVAYRLPTYAGAKSSGDTI